MFIRTLDESFIKAIFILRIDIPPLYVSFNTDVNKNDFFSNCSKHADSNNNESHIVEFTLQTTLKKLNNLEFFGQ